MAQKINGAQLGGYAFKARRATNLSSGSGVSIDIIFDQENYDYGDWYNPTTGLATAPVNGIYHFTVNAFTETTTTTRGFWTSRGSFNGVNNPNGTARVAERTADMDSSYYRRIGGQYEIYLNAGETFGVNLWTQAVQQLNHPDTWFSGYLVMAV